MDYDFKTSEFYSQNASGLAREYSKASPGFPEIFKNLLPEGSSILDAGCGTGRDLAELHQTGFDVTGAEASAEMITEAEKMYPRLAGRLIQTTLPKLKGVSGNFDGILCSGVLQHLTEQQTEECFTTLCRLLKNNGILMISFPLTYPGINPDTDRDDKGRLFIIRPAEYYGSICSRNRCRLFKEKVEYDSLERQQISWVLQVYRKRDE